MKSLFLFFILKASQISYAKLIEGKKQTSGCTGSIHLTQNSEKFLIKSEPLKRTNFDKYQMVEVDVMGSCCYKMFYRPKLRGEHKRLESAGRFSFPGKHVQSVARVECRAYRRRGVARAGGGPVGVALAGVLLMLAVAGAVFKWRNKGKRGGDRAVEEMEALNKQEKDIWSHELIKSSGQQLLQTYIQPTVNILSENVILKIMRDPETERMSGGERNREMDGERSSERELERKLA